MSVKIFDGDIPVGVRRIGHANDPRTDVEVVGNGLFFALRWISEIALSPDQLMPVPGWSGIDVSYPMGYEAFWL